MYGKETWVADTDIPSLLIKGQNSLEKAKKLRGDKRRKELHVAKNTYLRALWVSEEGYGEMGENFYR